MAVHPAGYQGISRVPCQVINLQAKLPMLRLRSLVSLEPGCKMIHGAPYLATRPEVPSSRGSPGALSQDLLALEAVGWRQADPMKRSQWRAPPLPRSPAFCQEQFGKGSQGNRLLSPEVRFQRLATKPFPSQRGGT